MAEAKTLRDHSEGLNPGMIAGLHKEVSDHREKMKSAQGKLRTVRKRMEENGVDGAAYDLALSLMKLDPVEAKLRLNRAFFILQALHAPVGSQLSFIDMVDDNAPGTDEVREKRWFDEGFHACIVGKTETDCPHALNMPAGQQWLSGYREAQSEAIQARTAAELAEANPVDDIGSGEKPKRRGRPAGSKNKPKDEPEIDAAPGVESDLPPAGSDMPPPDLDDLPPPAPTFDEPPAPPALH